MRTKNESLDKNAKFSTKTFEKENKNHTKVQTHLICICK